MIQYIVIWTDIHILYIVVILLLRLFY